MPLRRYDDADNLVNDMQRRERFHSSGVEAANCLAVPAMFTRSLSRSFALPLGRTAAVASNGVRHFNASTLVLKLSRILVVGITYSPSVWGLW